MAPRPVSRLLIALAVLVGIAGLVTVQTAAAAGATLYVDPKKGKDTRKGTKSGPFRSLDAAWRAARNGTTIKLAAGRIKVGPTYWEDKQGVTVVGAGMLKTSIPSANIFGIKDLTLRGVTVGGDVHCEQCDGFTLDKVRVLGRGLVQEGVKVNQSRRVTITGSDISGATDNAIDLVAVQHANVSGNQIHHAEDWCMYAKGGSAYVRVWDNDIHDCGTGGFTAGQGTGLQFMQAPWIQYEAYDVRVWNNRISDTAGAGLGANGAYDALFAHNTLLRVGSRSHALEVVFGLRSCDGQPGDEGRERCGQLIGQGAWGTTRVDDGDNAVRIPNKHVWFYDNIVVKAAGADTFSVADPFDGPSQDGSGVPRPALAFDDLQDVGTIVSADASASGPAHPIPAFTWDLPGVPAPADLSQAALTGLPDTAGAAR
ncbi:MAG: right-handed parallel beta-helix repeat-containing protein [Solirubrobacteraceae bacterium]|nr:right-handed parallel beta-helix repeat-containing protein [Solirubrobacteraceae bacterium]